MDAAGKQISEEAAEWLLRLEENPAARHHAEFTAWLARSPRHMDEFLMVEASFRTVQRFYPRERVALEAGMPSPAGEVIPFRQHAAKEADALPSRGSPRRKRKLLLAAAAAAGLSIAVAWLLGTRLQQPHYVTRTGEQRSFKLPDGSLLSLNTQSRVELDFNDHAREIHLVRGEALFTVKQDAARPFRVSTDTAVVQALGTSFNVYRRPDKGTFVSVMEGKVSVMARQPDGAGAAGTPASVPLAAGEEANVSEHRRIERNAASDVSKTLSWRQRRLVFRATRLDEVVAEFNRYNSDLQLRVSGSGDGIAQRRITGTFDADEPRAFVRFLAEDPSIELESRPGTVDIRMRRPTAPDASSDVHEPQKSR